MRIAASMVALVAFAAACGTGDVGNTLVSPHGPAFGKTPAPVDPTATFLFPLDDAALGLRSDHIATYVSGGSSAYADGVCGVHSKIFAYETDNGDAIMGTNDSKYADRRCPNYPRRLQLVLRDDAGNIVKQFSTGAYFNVYRVEDNTDLIPIGTTVLRSFTIAQTAGGCDVWWKPLLGDQVTPTGADQVNVTRTSATTWLVQTQPYPNDKAYCIADGHLYHVPVSFTIVASQAVP